MAAMGALRPYALAPTRPRHDLVDRLAARLDPQTLDGVLARLDRAGERCPVPGEAAGDGFTWDDVDRTDPEWWPQGVASLRSGRVLLVSWYGRRRRFLRAPASRISVVDPAPPDGPRYRHVRLVAPRRPLGLLRMGAVPVHAGGIAVQGDHLYVADTLVGVRVFRLGDVLRTPGGDYVLPQLMAFRVPLRAGIRRLRYSFLSIGQVDGRPNLVVGEYRRARDRAPRLARYPLDPATDLPAVDGDGRCGPLEVYEGQPRRMQGAAVHGRTWFVTASTGEEANGDLYVGAPGAWRRHRGVLPNGPEDLAWSRPGDELWCVSERPGRRWVFPVEAGRWPAPPDAGGPAGY